MDKYSKLVKVYVRIWFVAAIINAVISSCCIASSWNEQLPLIFVLSLTCSYIFSIPILLIAMLAATILLKLEATNNLFQLLFTVTFFVSFAGALFFKNILGVADGTVVYLCVSIVLSALAAVIIFKKRIMAIDITGGEV